MEAELGSDIELDENDEFMSKNQLAYFQARLLNWRSEILREAKATIDQLKETTNNHADVADRANSEAEHSIELRTRDRQRKLVGKIDQALKRIEDGAYGYCEETGEPIALRRLVARPIATLSIEAQERHEREEKVSSDD